MVNEGAWAGKDNGNTEGKVRAARNAAVTPGLIMTSPSYCGGGVVDNLENAYRGR